MDNYETTVTYMNPRCQLLKEIKMVKRDPKKVPSQISFLLVSLGTIAQLFTFCMSSRQNVNKAHQDEQGRIQSLKQEVLNGHGEARQKLFAPPGVFLAPPGSPLREC